MSETYSVYEHICPNGKRYIGITSRNPKLRWGKNGIGYKYHNKHFFNAICKYGWDNITHRIIVDGVSKECACQLEKDLIAKYKTNDRRFGYNNSTGGENPGTGVKKVISLETRIKISNTQKGRKLTDDWIKNIIVGRKDYKHSDETKRKISDATKIPILQYSLDNDLICEYESILEASINTNIPKQNICKCCKGHRQTAGGYKWVYKVKGSSHKKIKQLME